MNNLQIFQNEAFGKIRVINQNGAPWFVVSDICDFFGVSNRNRVMQKIDDIDKGGTQMDTPGGVQTVAIVNESGLYSLIFALQPTKARGMDKIIMEERQNKLRDFKRWVTSEVLPAIRKHGVYAVDEVLDNPDMLIAALTELKSEREKTKSLTQTVAVQNQQIVEMKPKASYYDLVLNCPSLLSATEIAKDYGKTANWLNKYLHEKGVQFKQGGIWLLYQKYAEKGYTSTKTHTFNGKDGKPRTGLHTYWNQKGRLFIYELLKQGGILPIMEREEISAGKSA